MADDTGSRCPECDPILHARSVICGACKAESFPVDAAWLDGHLILVTYEQAHQPGCPAARSRAATILVDLDAESAAIPGLPGPRRCKGTVRGTGRPCKSYAGKGSAFCAQHDPVRRAAR